MEQWGASIDLGGESSEAISSPVGMKYRNVYVGQQAMEKTVPEMDH